MTGLFNMAGRSEQRAAWRSVSWPEVAAFIGPNADRFEETWLLLSDRVGAGKPSMARSWSWPALLVPWAWLFYRKQWALGAMVLLIPVALSMLLPGAPAGATLGLYVMFAIQAKAHYLNAAVHKIAKLKSADPRSDRLENRIRQCGGVSTLAGFVSGAILGLILMLMVLAHLQIAHRIGAPH